MRSNKVRRITSFLQFAIFGIVLGSACVNAQKCTAPSDTKQKQIESYVVARFKLPSTSNVVLAESKQANDACFWRLKYETSNPKREIEAYLSPDGNYLSPTLYDVRIDPRVEEAAAKARANKALLGGLSPELGNKVATITVVEFSDFQCPFCKRMADVLRKDVLLAEGDRIHFIFKNNPLPMHSWAMTAASMAECVTLQKPGEFWKVHDFIFDNQAQLNANNIKEKITQYVAANVAIDQVQYKSCIDNNFAMGPVQADLDLGQKLGVRSTPTIFINGELYSGFKNAMQLEALLDAAQNGEVRAATKEKQ